MKVAVIGSRKFKAKERIEQIFINLYFALYFAQMYDNNEEKILIISGGAEGKEEDHRDGSVSVDAEAKRLAGFYCFEYKEELPKFKRDGTPYNVNDYHTRNDEIILQAEKVYAFWDGKSPGTKSVIKKCLGLEPTIFGTLRRNIEVTFDE